jgi:ribonuclease J
MFNNVNSGRNSSGSGVNNSQNSNNRGQGQAGSGARNDNAKNAGTGRGFARRYPPVRSSVVRKVGQGTARGEGQRFGQNRSVNAAGRPDGRGNSQNRPRAGAGGQSQAQVQQGSGFARRNDRPRTAMPLAGQLRGESRRRGRKPVKANWKHEDGKHPTRKGAGVRYGKLDLSPKNHYSMRAPALKQGNLRVVVMGGNEEVGRNMTMIEYGDDVVLIDMGIQFGEEHMRGIDGIVQDFSYLKGKEHKVRAVIITHMHMDHIGAIPYLMPMLPNVPLFSAPISLAMIAKKLEYTPEIKVNMQPIDEETVLELGDIKARFIGVSHSVPASLAVILETPCGKIVHTGDFKIDLNPEDEDGKRYLKQMQDLGNENILALLADSTNASAPGNQLMENAVVHDLETVISQAKGRLMFGLISTNVVRMGQIIHLAEKYGRQVCIGGLSLKTTLDIAENLGYIKPQAGTLIDLADARSLPANKVLAIFPGAQGESNAAFYRLADGDLREMKVVPGDTVVFSSSVIP